jgi:glycosyltransferase involved in cell wall biosynthesis
MAESPEGTGISLLHITPSYLPATIYGGPTLSVSRLCEAQVQLGATVRVLTTTANGPAELDVPRGEARLVNGVEVYYYRRLTKDHTHFSPALLWQVWRQCRRYDIVHIHSWWNLVAVLSAFLCMLRGKRFILSPRGMLSPYTLSSPLKRAFHRWPGAWILKHGTLHATTEQEAEECLKVVPNWLYFIAPNIIPLPPLHQARRASTQSAQRTSTLLFLSRIDPKKGLELLFQALAQTSYRLRIAGSGDPAYIASLKALAEQLGIAGRIEWLGWVEGEDKFRLLAEAELLVLTSHNENFANVVLESLAVGTPVLLSEQVGLSRYVQAKDLGWVTSLDARAIARALDSARADEGKRRRIREQAPALVREDFEAGKVAGEYMTPYTNSKKLSLLTPRKEEPA